MDEHAALSVQAVSRRSATLHDYPYATPRRKCYHKWIINMAPPGKHNCLHGCVYCYAREAIYARSQPGRFSYYENMRETVERELSRLRLCPPLSISNATDPCQNVPGLRKETERLVEMISKSGVSFCLVTKGDPSFLCEIPGFPGPANACLAITIEGTPDVLGLLSPDAPAYDARLDAVSRMSPLLPTMVRLDPVFPHLLKALYRSNWQDRLKDVLRDFASAGARHVISSTGRLDGRGKERMRSIIAGINQTLAGHFDKDYKYDASYTSRGLMLQHEQRLELHRFVRAEAESLGMTYATCQELDAAESDSEGLPHCEAFSMPFTMRGVDGMFHPIEGCTANCQVHCAGSDDPPCGRWELATYLPYKTRYLI